MGLRRWILGLVFLVAAPLCAQTPTSLPPGKIDIDFQTFEVVLLSTKNMGGAYDGLTYCKQHLILINIEEDDKDIRDSVVHEILHAITCASGGSVKKFNSYREKTHKGIYLLSPRLTYVMMNNPTLMEWLYEKSKNLPEVPPAQVFDKGPPPDEYKP